MASVVCWTHFLNFVGVGPLELADLLNGGVPLLVVGVARHDEVAHARHGQSDETARPGAPQLPHERFQFARLKSQHFEVDLDGLPPVT
eukprot:6516972-Pyramimonas_sp.AAC.1